MLSAVPAQFPCNSEVTEGPEGRGWKTAELQEIPLATPGRRDSTGIAEVWATPAPRGDPLSLHPEVVREVLEETTRVAQAAFPMGNVYIQMRDVPGTIYDDGAFPSPFATRGQPSGARVAHFAALALN